jgi:hypothetical protein
LDWAGAIGKNRDDLIGIVTRLYVMAGIRTGVAVVSLPRYLRIRILALLRPAEFAARRLIAVAACKLVTVTVRPSGEREARALNSVILELETGARQRRAGGEELKGGTDDRTHSVRPETSADMKNKASSSIVITRHDVHGMGPRLKAEDDVRGAAMRPAANTAPANPLPAFPLFDPFKPFGHPWLEDGEDGQAGSWHGPETHLDPDAMIDARALYRRIRTLERALQDLEGQAARLARWRARRSAESSSCSGLTRVRPRRFSPMRPGRPPGWRKRPKTPLEEVLKECDFLARDAWNTS